MTSPSKTTTPPRYTTASPPPYTPSDTHSVTSTSKSILGRVFNRKSAEATWSRRNEIQKRVDEEESKQAARAAYFSGL
ncbi:hypothetical protein BDW02DRAFT_565144 [Decorospora gaudefroyi]|uniref:Uncharacterized protein n=1 Tax=Decorospora gaudefroyi TaxID=184978 RepID=A0A6A5KMG3_9PLEO|nr:hypothetical protein BDW02DRAFT_565144 [Decorospora gaudefroyi]